MADKQLHYQNLTKLLAAGFFICGIIPILIIATTSIYNSKQVAIKDLEVTASQVIQHRQDVINNFLDHQIDLLTTLINLYPLEYLKEQNNLNQLFQAISASGNIVDLQIVDTNGEQLAYVGPYREQVIGKNYRDQPWFSEVLVRGAHVSDIFSGYRKIPHFVVALTDPLKRYVLRTTINSSVFNSLLRSAQIGTNGDVFIVNKAGELQTPSLQRNITTLDAREMQLIRHHSGPELILDDDTFHATTWLNNGTWLLMLKVRIPDMLGTYDQHLNRTLVIIVITATLFFIIAVFLSRFIVAHVAKADREAAALDQQMAHIEKMANIGRLAAGVAHEINNPLQMILAQAGWIEELLPEEDPTALKNLDEYQATIKKIKHHVERAATITHRLLGFARKISAEQEQVQINEVVEETLSFLEKEAKHNNIDVDLQLDPQLPATMTEGHRLQQILLNLIDNALDAVGHDGRVSITTSHTANKIAIQIADTGPGIPPEVMKRMWDPFFTTKEQGKGTGLGLAISQNIIRTLGGSIDVESKVGEGTVFTVKIPIKSLQQNT
ncbi:sensor histidine kinase [Desulfobulbus propionicus]|jgi:two-component system NtrC family sensor kinase